MIKEMDATIKPVVPKKEFVNYIHNFRGLAIIFVVAGHIFVNWEPDSVTYRFFRVFWENGTVLFVFIAGYLFQYLSKRFEYRSYLLKKVQNVIVPYLVVSLPIIVYRLMKQDYPGYLLEHHAVFLQYSTWQKLLYFLFTGAHMQQLWFVPMICLFYLAAPLLIYIDRHPKLYWLLILFAAVSILVEREPFNDIPRMFVHFISVYVFGMLLSHYRERYLELAKKYWVVLSILAVAAIVINYIYFPAYASAMNYVQKMIFCCFCIYWLWKLDRYIPRIFAVLAEVSFGIFFLHYYLVLGVRGVYQKLTHQVIPGNILGWFLYFIVVLAGTVIIIRLFQRLLGKKSRYIIGC